MKHRFSNSSISHRHRSNRAVATFLLAVAVTSGAAQNSPAGQSTLQQHYDQAQSLQSSGDLLEAAHQYRIFIADSLGEMALHHAHLGEYRKAAPLFDEALRLAPNSPGLKVRYAEAALTDEDFLRARTLCEAILHDYPANPKATAKAHLMLGRVLQKTNREAAARDQFEAAVALEPDFEGGYALAIAYLDLEDGKGASKVFAEMIAGLGDSAVLHMEIGRAYLNSDFQPEAVPELKKALAGDSRLPGVHYLLAVAYLTSGGGNSVELAKPELEAELKLSPNDANIHVQLGNIALRQHRSDDAARELQTAIALDPSNPDAFLYLGQLYNGTGQSSEAMAALRKSISFTKDPAYNRYQVQKAHYLLGRLLIQLGQTEAGKHEMQLSSALLNQSLNRDRDRLDGPLEATANAELADSTSPTPTSTRAGGQPSAIESELDEFEKRIAPAIADSYNNLGALAAGDGQFGEALISFERAFEWNPSLEGLDANWGRVAFLSKRFADAIPPMTRYVRSHPTDMVARSELAISQFATKDYSGTLATLKPAAAQLDNIPQLPFIYAASLAKTGSYDEGVKRLVLLEKDEESVPQFHAALGEGYAGQKNFTAAALELESSIRLNPTDAAAYCSLGAVEIEQGNLQKAVYNLEKAVALNPGSLEAHRQLALTYRKLLRTEDADREQTIYDSLNPSVSNK